MLIAAQAIEASFTHDVAMAALRVELSHRDPMDRLLAATASHYGLTLVTSDLQLLNGKGFQTIRADR